MSASSRNVFSRFLKVVSDTCADWRSRGKQFQMMGPWTVKLSVKCMRY